MARRVRAPSGEEGEGEGKGEGEGEGEGEAMEVEDEAGGDVGQWWDEGAAPAPTQAVKAIKKHHIYTATAGASSMAAVWVNLEFADDTGIGGVPSSRLSPTWTMRAFERHCGTPPICGKQEREQDGQVRA